MRDLCFATELGLESNATNAHGPNMPGGGKMLTHHSKANTRTRVSDNSAKLPGWEAGFLGSPSALHKDRYFSLKEAFIDPGMRLSNTGSLNIRDVCQENPGNLPPAGKGKE